MTGGGRLPAETAQTGVAGLLRVAGGILCEAPSPATPISTPSSAACSWPVGLDWPEHSPRQVQAEGHMGCSLDWKGWWEAGNSAGSPRPLRGSPPTLGTRGSRGHPAHGTSRTSPRPPGILSFLAKFPSPTGKQAQCWLSLRTLVSCAQFQGHLS